MILYTHITLNNVIYKTELIASYDLMESRTV